MDMYNKNVNADMLNGTFDAAQIEKQIKSIDNLIEYVDNDGYDAKWLKEHVGTSIGYGYSAFENYRLFVESPNTVGNETGKWTLVLYKIDGGQWDELFREIIGGKTRVSNWEKTASLVCIVMHRLLFELRGKLVDELDAAGALVSEKLVDAVMDLWGDENADAAETIDSWTYDEKQRRLNVYVGGFFLQSDVISSAADVRAFMDNIGYEIGSMLDGTSADVKDKDAVETAGGYAYLADVWGFDFSISDYLRDWADYNVIDLLTSDGIFGFKTLMEPTFEPNWQNGDTLACGKRRYTNDEFRDDVINFLYDWVHWAIDDALHTDDASNECDAVVNLLYDAWGDRFDIDVFHWLKYDAENECVFDPDAVEREKTPAENEIADYCRNYGYDCLMATYELYDDKTFDDDDDFVLLPMVSSYPDDFYDEFGDDADWDDDAMYGGMADALHELTDKTWRVECDGYRVYGYLTDTDPADELRVLQKQHGIAAGRLISDAISA